MKTNLSILVLSLLITTAACKKQKDTTPPPQQDIWPTAMGNTWTYKVTSYTASGASIDDGLFTLTIDATRTYGGKTYYGSNGQNVFYENESNKVFETDSMGSFSRLLAKSVQNTDTIYKGDATYTIGSTEYTGTIARVAYAYGTVINGFTCVKIEDLYRGMNGKLGKRVVSYYSPGTGPVSFLYYTNPEHPNSDSVYRTKGYILDSHTLH